MIIRYLDTDLRIAMNYNVRIAIHKGCFLKRIIRNDFVRE